MQRILIIKLGAVGDVIHSLPVLETLRACFPKAHLGWVVEEASYPILAGNPSLDELILLERRKLRGAASIAYLRRWMRDLKARQYDTVLDLHNLFKTGIIGYFSGASLRIGFSKWREGNFLFMNRRVRPPSRYQHAVDKYLSLLAPLDIREDRWVRRFPLVWELHEKEMIGRFWEQNGLKEQDRVVAINPGANWPSKRWRPVFYARVADQLIKQCDAKILLLWGPGEKHLAEAIASHMQEKGMMAPLTTLKELMPLIKRCRLFISGDTGPLHLAAALGVSTVALFGPSDPQRNGPYGEGHFVIKSSLPPATHWQIKEHGNQWMESIGVDRVMDAAIKQWRVLA